MPTVEMSAAAAMAAVTWLEGAARLPAGAVVLARPGLGAWRVREPSEIGAGWRVVAWWPPLTLAVVLATTPDDATRDDATPDDAPRAITPRRALSRLRARQRRTRASIAVLRACGALVLAGLVAGVPLATHRWGGAGLVASLGAVLYVALVASSAAYSGLRRAGVRPRSALTRAARCLWPFATLRGAAMVQEAVVAGAPNAVVARALLDDTAFASWVRPALWDHAHESHTPGVLADVAASLTREEAEQVAERVPEAAGEGDGWCPRCGMTYRGGVEKCAGCDVALGVVNNAGIATGD